jgi:RNA polymerase sigma factor (sigma-70 family)
MNSNSLIELINKAKLGDKSAFSSLYTELYTPLFRLVLSKTKNKDKTKDICQEVFLKWYEQLPSYEIKMRPLSYLMLIAIRLIINDSKKKKSLHLEEEAEDTIKDESIRDASDFFDTKLEISKIRLLFETLTEDQSTVISMRYFADADTETIAETLDTSLANVRKIESRALSRIRILYKEKKGKESDK